MRRSFANSLKFNKKLKSRGGFTLVELSVVLALLTVVMTMIISFSSLIKDYLGDSQKEYAFFEDCAKIKNELSLWTAENDISTNQFVVGSSAIAVGEETVSFVDGVLILGDKRISLDNVGSIAFDANQTLIKCTIVINKNVEDKTTSSFVFSLRSASITKEDGNG